MSSRPKPKYKIESDVPLPIKSHRGRPMGPIGKAMKKLTVGQSFTVEANLFTLHSMAGRYIGAGKYEIRAEGKGFRVWRSSL